MDRKSIILPTERLPRQILLYIAILVLVPTVIVFIAAEGYIRITRSHIDLWAVTGRRPGRNPIEKWALVDAFSAYKGRPGNYGKKRKSINKHGFISTPDISVSKPENTLRIVFLGGSAAAGTAVTGQELADEDTWPWKVADILRPNSDGKKIEFINAALGGYTTFESFGRLWSRIRFFSPDIIVVYHGWNEMYYFNKETEFVNWKTLLDGSWGVHITPKIVIYKPKLIDHFVRYSQVLTKIRLRITRAVSGEVGISKRLEDNYDRRGLEVFRTNLRLIKETASIFGAKLFVAKQATLVVPNITEEDKARCRYDWHGFSHEAHLDAFKQIYHIIDDEIAADYIIDTSRLSGVSEYFYDHIHPTELGSQKIAETVAKALIRKIH